MSQNLVDGREVGTESLCRQTLMLMPGQNAQLIPPGYDLAEAQHDLATYDLLHPRFSRLRQLPRKAEDTEMALGSDILIAALEGYALAKAIGKGAGLDALKETMATRFSGRRRASQASHRMNRRRAPPGATGAAPVPPGPANDAAVPPRGTLSWFGTASSSIGTASSSSADTAFPRLNHDSIDAGDAFVARNDELVPWHSDVVVPNILR
jgi:hypothetical protein